MSLEKYLETVGGIIDGRGNVISKETGKFICDEKYLGVFEVIGVIRGDDNKKDDFNCLVLDNKWGIATIKLINPVSSALLSFEHRIPSAALY